MTKGVLRTHDPVQALGRSKWQLLLLIDAGYLTHGVHLFRGLHRNFSITWDVEACQARFGELASMPRPVSESLVGEVIEDQPNSTPID